MGDADMNERDDNQELYEIHYVFQEGNDDKIYYIVARSLISAIDRFYKLQPTNKIRLIRLLAERDIQRFEYADKPDRLHRVGRCLRKERSPSFPFYQRKGDFDAVYCPCTPVSLITYSTN